MADKLTPQQAQAVHDRGGNLLVSAAAGSGKTKVLVDRLLSYLTDQKDPADLDEFLIITYTKAAASELRGKIASKLTERIADEPENRHLQKQIQRLFLTKISTVHGFCSDLLREYAYKLDLPADFRVADENECRQIRQTVLADLLDRAYLEDHQDADFRSFVDTQGLGRDDRLVPELIEKVYDSARCHLDPSGWLEDCVARSDPEDVRDLSETVWGRFLMDDLHCYLDAQIHVIQQCVHQAQLCEGLEKQVMNLQDTLYQMQQLRNCTLWDDIVRHNKIEFGRLVFPRKNPDPELTERIKAVRTACKKGLEKKLHAFTDLSDQALADMQQCAAGTRGLVALVKCFDREYSSIKRRNRILDFGDLEHKALDLLLGKSRTSITAAAREIGRRYREIMVDEYQDSNGVQDAIFSALTQERKNCFMVGDVKQSIYQFRLADPGIFLEKYHSFVPAEEASPGEGRKIFLSHNFRSGPEVISAVNDVFCGCMTRQVGGLDYGEAESLREGIPHAPLQQAVELHCIESGEDSYKEEASYVADQIQTMLKNGTKIRQGQEMKAVEPEDIVILLRSPGSVGRQFQQALEEKGIRCMNGGGSDLMETEEIGTLYSLLQIIINPRQDIPLISALLSPVFDFSADDLAQIRSRKKKGSFYDALLESDMPKAESFLDILSSLRRDARQYSLSQLLEKCYALTRIDSIYGSMTDGCAKQKNLQAFFRLAVEYEQGSLRDLSQFLQHLDSLEGKGINAADSSSSGCVTIMSIHKSKGLEFPVVFLCSLSRAFNRESLRSQILCDQELGLGLSIADFRTRVRYPSTAKRAIMVKAAAESLSEEMRVLYVAMTRARDRLIMTYTEKNLQENLLDMALRMDFDGGDLLCRDASCPGKWILLAALQRMEAGQLHSLGGRPSQIRIGQYPWKVCIGTGSESGECSMIREEENAAIPQSAVSILEKGLAFSYPHLAATQAPSKQTATGRKSAASKTEVFDFIDASQASAKKWKQPSFASFKKDARIYGNAIHSAMQYIRYENCSSLDTIRQEISRLSREGFLTEELANMVDCQKLITFFETEIGRKLRGGVPCLREFKFSILDDGTNYGAGLEGEKILLQGVVDCALVEPDGITIVDFKSDKVTDATLTQSVEQYRTQVDTYAEALMRIYELPVKGKYLYYFHMDQFCEL